MIERTGPQDKPLRQAPDYPRKHPIRNALQNLVALLFAAVILVGGLLFLLLLIAG